MFFLQLTEAIATMPIQPAAFCGVPMGFGNDLASRFIIALILFLFTLPVTIPLAVVIIVLVRRRQRHDTVSLNLGEEPAKPHSL